jgi:hypothetical protein
VTVLGSPSPTLHPGTYDLKFVDQDNDVCEVRNVAIYEDMRLNLSEGWLVSCEVNTLTARR